MSSIFSSTDLKQLSTHDTVELFKTLETASIEEMNGEYAATMLKQPSLFSSVNGVVLQTNPIMPWLCKAFRPVDEVSGRGYNTFSLLGNVIQRFPMRTVIAPSRYDGKPAYQLVYRAYHSFCGAIHMVDEVRRVAPDLYLGIGTWGFTKGQRQVALPFILEPTGDNYRGDIGTERKGFILANEVPASMA